ncbi:hypothetical protein ACLB1G_11730 [Oxalobacteraceae bacterium A2-2]
MTFTFARDSQASKYDQWSYYRNQFQRVGNSKAVDIIVLQDSVMWLIEVKDYRLHGRTKVIDLADEIAIKVRDTLAGLVAAKVHAPDMDEKRFAATAVRARSVRVVFHLEQPATRSRLRPQWIDAAQFTLKLRTLLKAVDPHSLVVSRNAGQALVDWSVT